MSAEQEVEIREHEWMDAWIRKDLDACRRILADDFLLTSARGVLMSKEEWLEGAMGPFEGKRFDWEKIRVRMLAPNIALVHGTASQVASVSGRDWSGRFLLSDVWMSGERGWQVVARHGTGPLEA